MIVVDIKELGDKINELSKLIQDYEYFTNSIYHEFQNISTYWNDNKKQRLFFFIETGHKNNQKLIGNLKEHYQIYQRLYQGYSQLGQQIRCNLEAKDLVLAKVETVINQMQSILNLYNNLGNLSFVPLKIRTFLYNEQDTLGLKIGAIQQIKEVLQRNYEKIEEIEEKVSTSIAKNTVARIPIDVGIERI